MAKAHSLQDFIIPLRVDGLAYSEMNIEVFRLNTIDFCASWAAGLAGLVAKLRKDSVPTTDSLGATAVREWWQQACDENAGVTDDPERHVSNWFPLTLPDRIFVHTLTRDTIGLVEPPKYLPFPFYWQALRLITFAHEGDLTSTLTPLRISNTDVHQTDAFLSPTDPGLQRERRNIATGLVADAWEQFALARGLKAKQMANGRNAFYFDAGSLPKENVTFVGVDGEKTYRALRGYRTVGGRKQHWHFAVSAKPAIHPEPMLMVRHHVFFSDDERTLWSSADRMHRARRSQCKGWWNDTWRDRLLASLSWLAQGEAVLSLPFNGASAGGMAARPSDFESPVALHEPSSEPEVFESREDDADDADEAGT
jgi:hypothetical protein